MSECLGLTVLGSLQSIVVSFSNMFASSLEASLGRSTVHWSYMGEEGFGSV